MFSFQRAMQRSSAAASGLAFIGGLGLGAVLMYFLDPSLGRHRRALLKSRAAERTRILQDATEAAVEAAAVRTRAAVARITQKSPEDAADDSVLGERVRAAIGRVVADAQAIEVRVREGIVTLKGPARAEEIAELVACAGRVRGVKEVDNRLSLSGSE
ncbi:MAG: BON domain-containing protein [Usitatibacter sp.]